jgi:hypothetical protein
MALRKPVQLKDSSPAEASPTPAMMGIKVNITGSGVASPRITLQQQQQPRAAAVGVRAVAIRQAGREA